MASSPHNLDYAPADSSKKPVRRKFILLAVLIAALYVGINHGLPIASAVRKTWVQGRCATFEYADDTVIYETDPARGRSLIRAEPDEYVRINDPTVWPTPAVIRREPRCWSRLKDLLFSGRQFWPPGPPAPKAMVHKLRTANGEERIIALIIAPALPPKGSSSPLTPPTLQLVAAAVKPAPGFTDDPRWDGNSGYLQADFESARSLRFFSARLDPADAARFTVRYEFNDQPGVIDGVLLSDGSISLTVRDGPAKSRARTSRDGT